MSIKITSVLKAFIIVGSILLMGCDLATIEGSEDEFFLAKEWKIIEYYKGDELMTTERAAQEDGGPIENYRLKLSDDFTYERTFFDGSKDNGTWYLTAEGTYLNLDSDAPDLPKKWQIIELKIRKLEMLLVPGGLGGRMDDLNIPLKARLILEPVKGQ